MQYLSFFMDCIVLIALIGTIFFALRLTKSLNAFKTQREQMKGLMDELGRNIDDAQNAIHALRKTGDVAARNLEDLLHDSKKMADELRNLNEVSDNMASRLADSVSDRKRGGASQAKSQTQSQPQKNADSFVDGLEKAPKAKNERMEPPSFFIQDREYESKSVDDGEEDYISEAERELLAALHHKQGA